MKFGDGTGSCFPIALRQERTALMNRGRDMSEPSSRIVLKYTCPQQTNAQVRQDSVAPGQLDTNVLGFPGEQCEGWK